MWLYRNSTHTLWHPQQNYILTSGPFFTRFLWKPEQNWIKLATCILQVQVPGSRNTAPCWNRTKCFPLHCADSALSTKSSILCCTDLHFLDMQRCLLTSFPPCEASHTEWENVGTLLYISCRGARTVLIQVWICCRGRQFSTNWEICTKNPFRAMLSCPYEWFVSSMVLHTVAIAGMILFAFRQLTRCNKWLWLRCAFSLCASDQPPDHSNGNGMQNYAPTSECHIVLPQKKWKGLSYCLGENVSPTVAPVQGWGFDA